MVKTRQFRHPQYVGDPTNAVRIFNDKEADELIVVDISASREGRGPDLDLIKDLAGECFMPLTYGGGVRSLEDAARIFDLGVEKVALQSTALRDPRVVEAIAGRYGSQSVVLSVDVVRHRGGHTSLRRIHGAPRCPDWLAWLRNATETGAGEVFLTAVACEGTLKGLDLELIRQISDAVTVPVIAHGGVGSMGHIRQGFSAGASAVAVGAYFVLYGPHRAVLISYPSDSEFSRITEPR